MPSVVVVGGGVSGLCAARRLAIAGCEVTVLEAAGRFGGKLAATTIDGVRLDTGAESVLARRPEAIALIDELGLAGARVHPSSAAPHLLVGGHLAALPPSLQGIPTDLEPLRGLLSAAGWQRAAAEPTTPAPPLTVDLPIGVYVDARFGAEVTDRLLEPLLGGVYAGRARDLSFDAVSHPLFLRAQAGGSLLQHARDLAQSALSRPVGPVFAGLPGGVATLVDALVADLQARGVTLRLGATARELVQTVGGRFTLTAGPVPAPEQLRADAVVLAAPAAPTGRLLSGLVPTGLVPTAGAFAAIPYASVAVITLVVRGLRTGASGVLVPAGELPTVKAMTHSSLKWDWVGEAARRAFGPDAGVVRASVGRVGETALLQLPDEPLVARTLAEASSLPGWERVQLVTSRVTRWGGGLPQYQVGHRRLVAALRSGVEAVPGLAVAGAALDGVGIPACIGGADAAAAKIVADLAGQGQRTTELEESRA